MRPVDITELDESARWHAIHGGDAEEGVAVGVRGGGANGGAAGHEQAQVARRKKAPIRSRRRGLGLGGGHTAGVGGSGGGDGVHEEGMNGIGDVG